MNNMSLKRLYLDTESLLDIFIDRKKHSSEDIAIMNNAKKFWNCFKWDKIRISPYVIGEFISVGNRRFGRSVEKLVEIINEQVISQYLFSWDDIPGNDNIKLIEFIERKYGFDGLKEDGIKKIDDNTRTVSYGDKTISLTLNKDQKLTLQISDGRTDEFIVKTENGKLNIYIQNCKVLTAKVQPDPTTAVLDNVFFNDYKKKYTLLCMRYKGEATIDNKRAGIHEVSFAISKDLWEGNWSDYNAWTKDVVKGLSFINKPQITLNAPYFELGFFQKASDFAEKYKLPLKDAIHLVYVNREEVDIIVTKDKDFDNVNLDGIEIMPPEEVVNKYCPQHT